MPNNPIQAESDQPDVAAVAGTHKATTDQGFAMGVHGTSDKGEGVRGETNAQNHAAVAGFNNATANGPAWGVFGRSQGGEGVHGESQGGVGVVGRSNTGFAAVHGNGGKNGVWGYTTSVQDSGVFGQNDGSGNGVAGLSKDGVGVRGETTGNGIAAVHGHGTKNGVWGYTTSPNDSGVWGHNDGSGNGVTGTSKSGIGVLGIGGHLAGRFEGDVEVTGDLRLVNADCAEDFDIAGTETIEPGTVMVLDQHGALQPSQHAYDKRVAGVISGAGDYKPGIVLDKQPSDNPRLPIALLGKVYCKVDAQQAPIAIGDLLTTSPTAGHAMKAEDPCRAFGAVIGKALRPLSAGQGLIPILIALQ